MNRFGRIIPFLSVLTLAACGGGDGKAKISFANSTSATRELAEAGAVSLLRELVSRAAPTVFQMKLIAAYIAADIDPTTQNNTGITSMIYLNNDCTGDDIMHCDISGGTAEDGAPMSHIVTSYFDFGATSAAVNAALNAQERTVTAGTYKYARLEFCKYNSGAAKNIKWADGTTVTTASPQEFKRNSCTVNSAVISPPITVAAGSTVTITITYNLASSITTGASCSGDDTAGTGDGKRCFSLPTFVPSAS